MLAGNRLNVDALTKTLSAMDLPQLQQYAELHKNDPYVVTMALSIANQKKQIQTAAQGQAGQQPMPKVVDQELAQIAPRPAPVPHPAEMAQQTPMPEDVGIGRLPAENLQRMAGGGIVAFGDGGDVPAYSGEKGSTVDDPTQEFATKYRPLAEQVGKRLGVDPAILIAQWGHESGWGKKTVGDYNFGNIKDVSGKGPRAYDKMEKSRSSYKSYDSPEAFANDYASLIERNYPQAVGAGSDVKAFSAGLQKGRVGAYATDPNYGPKLEKTLASLIPSAQAAQTTQAAPSAQSKVIGAQAASQIPGSDRAAPAKKTEDGFLSSDSFQRGAEAIGLSRDVGRDVYNTLMATTPLAPATGTIKTAPGLIERAGLLGERLYNKLVPTEGLSKEGIAALRAESELARKAAPEGQLLLTGPQAKLPGTNIPVTPAGEGITNLVQPARMVPPGPEATRLEQMAAAANARKAAQAADTGATTAQVAKTAEDVVTGPSAAEKIQAASMLREGEHAAQVGSAAARGQAAKTGLGLASAASTAAGPGGLPTLAAPGAAAANFETGFEDYIKQMPKDQKKDLGDLGKAALKLEGKKSSKFEPEDIIAMGLAIASGTSPNAITNIGAGGLQGLAMRQARLKEEADTAYKEAIGRHYGTDPFVKRLQALQDPENVRAYKQMKELEREPMTKESLFKQFMSSPAAMALKPEEISSAFQRYVQSYESVLGPIGGLPQGVTVTPGAI